MALNDDGIPTGSANQAGALAQDPDVLAVIGPWDSAEAAAAVPVLQNAGIPVLVAAPLAPAVGVRSLCPPPEGVAEALLSLASRFDASSVALDGPPNALALALQTIPRRAGAEQLAGGSDRSTVVRVYTGEAAGGALQALRQWRSQGWLGRIVGGPDMARDWFAGRAGVAPGEVRWQWACAPGAAPSSAFLASYQTQTGTPPGPDVALAYYERAWCCGQLLRTWSWRDVRHATGWLKPLHKSLCQRRL